MNEFTSVGLDVHARSVVAAAIDGGTGEVFRQRLIPDHGQIESWIKSLPGPWRVTYEAGPTGFGLARYLDGAGIEALVAAPSKLQRPVGDRVKTDRRTRCIWPNCCIWVRSSRSRFHRSSRSLPVIWCGLARTPVVI